MYEDSKNRDIYFNTLRKSYETEIDAEMRTLINDFDRAVNPFLEMEVSDEMSLSNLIVKGNVYTARGRNKRENCCYLELKDKNNSNLVRMYRNAVGFSYQLGVTLDDNSFMDIRHFYSPISAGVHTKGEFLCVEYWGKESQSKLTLIYNLTDETINTSYTEVFLPITDEQKFLLLRKLRTAVDLASEVTIANLNEGNCLNLAPRK